MRPKTLFPLFLTLLSFFTHPTTSVFTVQCYSRLYDGRVDPIVSPGTASGHVHTIAGGNAFSESMTSAQARTSTCNTCNRKLDNSNYWAPKMYFHAKDGSYQNVPISGDIPNDADGLGGMAIYYNTHLGPGETITPFPDEFRMIAGDPFRRSYNASDQTQSAVGYTCIENGDQVYPGFPDFSCSGGLRAQVIFPSCWDGAPISQNDYKGHVVYPVTADYNSACPTSHPHHLFNLFLEVTYHTDAFTGQWEENVGSQPFVLASGDPTGYGFHADFLNGWDPTAIAEAAKLCTPDNCNAIPNWDVVGQTSATDPTHNTEGEAYSCKLTPPSNEQVNGVLAALPGCNDLQFGPQEAIPDEVCGSGSGNGTATSTATVLPVSTPVSSAITSLATSVGTSTIATSPPTSTTPPSSTSGIPDLTSLGWTYIGCGLDVAGSRTFNSDWTWSNSMTNTYCVNFCQKNGYSYAGSEFADQCFCADALEESRAPTAGTEGGCDMECAGASGEVCGGAGAITIWQASAKVNSTKREVSARRGGRAMLSF